MKPVTFKPSDGGQLITRRAASEAGPANYVVKRNWRRDLDSEVWREGFVPFAPDPEADDVAAQCRPTTSPIRLIKSVLWQDGSSALVAGSATDLYLFDNPGFYVVEGYADAAYTLDGQRWRHIGSGFSAAGRRWQAEMVNGTLWLNNSVDLPMTYSRGDDAAVPSYELREQGILSVDCIAACQSIPVCLGIKEVSGGDTGLTGVVSLISSGEIFGSQAGARTSGNIIAAMSVGGGGTTGTVTSSSAFFQVGDVGRQIQFGDGQRATVTGFTSSTVVSVARIGGDVLAAITTPRRPLRVTDPFNPAATSQDAWSLNTGAGFFTSGMVGRKLSVGREIRTITAFVSATHVKVDSDLPAGPAATVFVENPDAYLRPDQMTTLPDVDERNDTVLWGNPGDATDFGLSLKCAGTAGETVLATTLQSHAFSPGQEVVIEGAGQDGGILTSNSAGDPVTLLEVGPGIFKLSTPLLTGGADLRLRRATSVGSIVGYEQLEDEGGAIINAKMLGGQLVIHKDRSAFTATYTGVVAKPFVFVPITMPHDRSLHFRHCVASVNDEVQVYPGRTAFWMFEPVTRKIRAVPNADNVENLFFDYASVDDTDDIFVSDNTVTQELWWFNATNPTDPILCYDYRWNTFSTADTAGILADGETPMPAVTITAAASIQGPGYAVSSETETWFLMGCEDGRLLTYGAVSALQDGKPDWDRKSLYFRQATEDPDTISTYECVLASGLSSFGDEVNQKRASGYLVQFGRQPSGAPDINVRFYTANSQAAVVTLAGQADIVDVANHGRIPLHLRAHNIQDVITSTPPSGVITTPLRLLYRAWDIIGGGDRSHGRRS